MAMTSQSEKKQGNPQAAKKSEGSDPAVNPLYNLCYYFLLCAPWRLAYGISEL